MPILCDAAIAEKALSHYEYVAPNYDAQKEIKDKALARMSQLDGWCSKEKAGVMMDLVFNHRPEVIVEIGVYGGMSLIPMALAAQYNGAGIVYGIDPWISEASAKGMEGVNREWWSKLDHNKIFSNFSNKLTEYRLNKCVSVVRTTSEEAPIINNIGLLHIDGNHSEESSLHDVKKWVPLVKSGGIVIFDDVTWGTTDAAVRWLDQNCLRVTTYHGDNVWGIWVKPL